MEKPKKDKLKHILVRKGIGGLTLIDFLGIEDLIQTKEILIELAKEGDIFLPINLKENIWTNTPHKGWGNGYVDVPKRHPCYGKTTQEITDSYQGTMVNQVTYSDLTDSGWWRVGFDSLGRPDLQKEDILDLTLDLLIELYKMR
jgi:hypothetical protein